MTLTLTDEEYSRLMMLSFMGEWMINAIRKDPDPEYEDVASKIYSFARGTPSEDQVVFDSDLGDWVPTEAFEENAQAMIDQYDDTTFWEELTARLTERDLVETHGERAVGGMRPDQREREISAIAKDYTREFEEQGLARLRIV